VQRTSLGGFAKTIYRSSPRPRLKMPARQGQVFRAASRRTRAGRGSPIFAGVDDGAIGPQGWREKHWQDHPLTWTVAVAMKNDPPPHLDAFGGSRAAGEKHLEAVLNDVQLHAELERRVNERTAELEKANAALQAEIVERKRTESALRESEHRARQLVNALPAAVYACDTQGYITLYNEAAVAP
jgi:PAS domain-containing protein